MVVRFSIQARAYKLCTALRSGESDDIPGLKEHLLAKTEFGGEALSEPVGNRRVGHVVEPVLDRSLAGDDSLDVVAEHSNHSKTAVLNLLNLKLGSGVRILGETERIEELASRVQRIRALLSEWSTVDTVGFSTTHKDDLGQKESDSVLGVDDGRELGVQDDRVSEVLDTLVSEDVRSGLEPLRVLVRNVGVHGEKFRHEAAEGTGHSPASMDKLGLTVPLEGGRIGGESNVVPSVVSRELTGEVSRRGSERTKPLRTVRTVPLNVAGLQKSFVSSFLAAHADNIVGEVSDALVLALLDEVSGDLASLEEGLGLDRGMPGG